MQDTDGGRQDRIVLIPLHWRVLKHGAAGEPVEWYAHALCGALAYHIRLMRDGRFAFGVNGSHEPAVPSFAEAARWCDNDRHGRIEMELL